jgi:hypothetical protein
MVKRIALIFVFVALLVGGLSAQEKRGYIKPTFALGFVTLTDFTGVALSMDIDFVSRIGLTLGLQDVFAWNSDVGVANIIPVGIGYTYGREKWSVGGKLMGVPLELLETGGVGIDVNGTYWLKENLGFTGILDLYFPKDATTFSLRVGVSFKY